MYIINLRCKTLLRSLISAGMSDQWIMKKYWYDRDELLRPKQISGLVDLFANREFSIPDEVAPTETEQNLISDSYIYTEIRAFIH